MNQAAEFDQYSGEYDAMLQQGVGLSGEDGDYFAAGRVAWMRRRLREMGESPRTVLDFGCGHGSATGPLLDLPSVDRVVGVDPSEALLARARIAHESAAAEFSSRPETIPDHSMDLAHCNGVFHHIPPDERAEAIATVVRLLRPGGLFAFWENTPWNPGTRMVMRRIPFDRDAVLVTPRRARRLLTAGGFTPVRTDFQFVFPRQLRALRGLESRMARLPLGAQYMVLARAGT